MNAAQRPVARDPRGPSEAVALRQPPASRPSRISVDGISDAAIGGVLRNARRRRGITQSEVAVILRVSTVTIRHWEAGLSRVPPARRYALASLLGISEADLRRADDIVRTEDERVLLRRFRAATEDERRAALKAVCP